MAAFDGGVLVGRMVKDVGREERVRRGKVLFLPLQVFPVQVFLFCFGINAEREEGKKEQ